MNYLAQIGELIRAELDPNALPDEPTDDLLRSYAVLALVVGPSTTAMDVHDAWVAWMLDRDPDHPSLVPFTDLDPETASQDSPFVAAIRAVSESQRLGRHK